MLEHSVSLTVYLFLEILTYILIYTVFLEAQLTRSKFKIIGTVLVLFMMHFGALYTTNVENAYSMSSLTMILVPLFLFQTFHRSYVFIYPFFMMATATLGVACSYFVSYIQDVSLEYIIHGSWYTTLCQSVVPVVLIGVSLIARKKNVSFRLRLNWQQYIVLYVVGTSLFFMIGSFQIIITEHMSQKVLIRIGMGNAVACVMYVGITIWQAVSTRWRLEMKERNALYEGYMDSQREYYESLLQQEEKMRRFRHDFHAHITALQMYAQNEELENIQMYLKRMAADSDIFSVYQYTGNRVVDAVLTKLKEEAEDKQIKLEIQGHLIEETTAKSYDLCIIISNVIKNAIEACEKIDDISQRRIQLKANMYESTIHISVKNTTAGDVRLEGKFPVSTKKEGNMHGLGYGNIEQIVNKYGGMVECITSKNQFEVNIML